MQTNVTGAGKHYNAQFSYLVAGGVLFVVWNVVEIILRSYPATA
jgi:hypothetical protein